MGLLDFLKKKKDASSPDQAASAASIEATSVAEAVPSGAVSAPEIAEPVPAEASATTPTIPMEETTMEEVKVEAASVEETPELTCKEQGKVYQVRMNFHAGYDQYREWPNGGKTIHSGIGWFHPFGVSNYYGIQDCGEGYNVEAADYPLDKFFTEDWQKEFETDLFCIYRMEDGDIYAWDGMFAIRGIDPHECVIYNSVYTRQDVCVNVVVGGTGRYEGARGLLIGTTEGGGETKGVTMMPDGNPLELPATIIKHLEGYVRIPNKD